MSRLCQRCFCSITLLRQHSYPLQTYTSYTHTTQIQDVGGTRVCSCSVVLSTFAVNSGYCGLNFIGPYCCDVIHILRADTLYDVANILTRVLLAWASPHLLSLVTAVNLELSATLAGCFRFFFLRLLRNFMAHTFLV